MEKFILFLMIINFVNGSYIDVLEWAGDVGYKWSEKVKFNISENNVYCYAGEDIQVDDQLIFINEDFILSSTKGVFKQCGNIYEGLCEALRQEETDERLVLYIAVVRNVKKGPFSLYIENLPDVNFTTNVLLWPETVQKFFKIFNGPYYEWIGQGEKMVTLLYEKWGEKFKLTKTDLYHALFLVKSRVFGFVDNGEDTITMIPVLDYINHHPQHSQYFRDNGEKIMKSDVEYKKGDEIFARYGQNTNPDLLIVYGFILPNNPVHYIHLKINDTLAVDMDSDCYLEDGLDVLRYMSLKEFFKSIDEFDTPVVIPKEEDTIISVSNELAALSLFVRLLEVQETVLKKNQDNILLPELLRTLIDIDLSIISKCIPIVQERTMEIIREYNASNELILTEL
jgi:hypothetical protein